MRKFILSLGMLLVICCCGCEKNQNGSVTFYVNNAGDKNVTDHISIEVEDKLAYFFTPKASNMSLIDCQRAAPHSARICLPEGTYQYHALGEKGTWKGSITIKEGQCEIIKLSY